MCFSSPSVPTDNSAAVAQAQQAANQANIAQGVSTINDAFSQFNPSYYSGIQNAYTAYEEPQLDQQYTQANNNLIYALNRAGIQDSSAGAYETGLLNNAYGNQKTAITNQAQDASNQQASAVANAKNNLLNLNTTSADPSSVAADTTAQIQTLQTPAAFQPLGNVLGSVIDTGSIGAAGSGATAGSGLGGVLQSALASNPQQQGSGGGSSTTVNG